MWKTWRAGEKIVVRLKNAPKCRRTFLSEAYRCQEAWSSRFDSSILQKVKLTDMFYAIEQTFQREGKASAIDIDLFANAIKDDSHIEELADLVHKLRLSPETSKTLESTHHAVVRSFISTGRAQELLGILNDRINYGIFPDHFSYNLLMDSFTKDKDYTSAARVAVLLMLQEDHDHPISNALGLYSCHMYLKNPGDTWKAPEPEVDDNGEEVKVRVKFIRNPFFDDHFDLREPSDLVGKTLSWYGKHLDDSLGRTCQLRGLVLYKKYGEASSLIREWVKNGTKHVIFEEGLKLVRDEVSKIPEDKITDEVKELSTELNTLEGADFLKHSLDEAIENKVKVAVNQQGERDISEQCQKYLDWENTRQSVLQEHLAELERQNRLAKVAEMKKDLEEKERVLTFFEREDEIDLAIDSKKIRWRKKWFGKKKNPRTIDVGYIPPEITRQRRQ